MFKKSSNFFLTILLCEILTAFLFIAADFAGAAQTANYTPTYLKGFGGNPAELVINIYKYALGAVGIVAFGAIVYGAILRITSAGNPSQVQEANAWIIGAVSGIALLFGSYLILETINPKLVDIGNIEKIITPTIKVTTPKNPFVTSTVTSTITSTYTCETTIKVPGARGYGSAGNCQNECSGVDKQCIQNPALQNYYCETTQKVQFGIYGSVGDCQKNCSAANSKCVLFK